MKRKTAEGLTKKQHHDLLEGMTAQLVTQKVLIALMRRHMDGSDIQITPETAQEIARVAVKPILRRYVKTYKE